MSLLAQAAADPTGALIQYGSPGVIAALLAVAVRVLFKQVIEDRNRERERGDRLEAEVQRLNAVIQDKTLVTLGDATHAISEALALTRKDRR